MKQFQKYGVAAAVASLAAGTFATEVSKDESGDLAIVPYYTVEDGQQTGIHIINTTDATQVVKVRLRRGSDSKDALDFNVVMSPRDEWTANIGAGGANGVRVSTKDTTCTVPAFKNDGKIADMPATYSEGATEGYIEIIGMAQTTNETNSLSVGAKHAKGVPADCATVREHFYRVAGTSAYDSVSTGAAADTARNKAAAIRGVHTSDTTSSGACSAGTGGSAFSAAACSGGSSSNATFYKDTSDTALKVSWIITDSDSGLEMGDNAVHVEAFASAPMMTNQQPLSFGSAGVLRHDPLNFELPNLAYGAYKSSSSARQTDGANGTDEISSGKLFNDLRAALQAESVLNDWAGFSNDDATVAADWVVTLPGQYAMTNPICGMYDNYALAKDACVFAGSAIANGSGITKASALDENELPLTLASTTTTNPLSGSSNLSLWDREEASQAEKDPTSSDGLDFSPNGSAGEPTDTILLTKEVNVITFNEGNVLKSANEQDEEHGLKVVVTVPDADKGWGQLKIDRKQDGKLWSPNGEIGTATGEVADDGNIDPNESEDAAGNGWGDYTAVTEPTNVMVVGFAAWSRQYANQERSNYGRAVEHTTIASSR